MDRDPITPNNFDEVLGEWREDISESAEVQQNLFNRRIDDERSKKLSADMAVLGAKATETQLKPDVYKAEGKVLDVHKSDGETEGSISIPQKSTYEMANSVVDKTTKIEQKIDSGTRESLSSNESGKTRDPAPEKTSKPTVTFEGMRAAHLGAVLMERGYQAKKNDGNDYEMPQKSLIYPIKKPTWRQSSLRVGFIAGLVFLTVIAVIFLASNLS